MGRRKSVIMDGRDIGTVVLRDAEYKFYLTATAEERAMRRYKELREKGSEDTYEKVLEDVNRRDYNDMHREVDPLRQAEDAVLIDSTNMSIDEVVDFVISRVRAED
jgi:cytidylate kinase